VANKTRVSTINRAKANNLQNNLTTAWCSFNCRSKVCKCN